MNQWTWVAPAALGFCLISGCGDDAGDGDGGEGEGSVEITITGEDGAKEGFPVSDDGEEIAFVDGWTLTFSKYLVSVGALELSSADGASAFGPSGHFVVDLSSGDPSLGTFDGIGARRWERFNFAILPPSADMEAIDVSAADAQTMVNGGYNYWVEGTASHADKGDVTFAWGFANPTANTACTNGLDDTEGIVVNNNSTTEGEITMHVEHLFWDSLGDEEAELRFDPVWGADKDADGNVTIAELEAQRIADLTDQMGNPLTDGGSALLYDPASIQLADANLYEFMKAATASQAHLNGSGLCTIGGL